MMPPIHQVIQGDCIKGMESLDDQSVDFVFADPPFNVGYRYDVYRDRMNDQAYLDWSEEWMRQAFRVLRPHGSFWLAIGDKYAAELKVIAHRHVGFEMRHWVIWRYPNGQGFKHRLASTHTHLLDFVKDSSAAPFHLERVQVPSSRHVVYKDKRALRPTKNPDDVWMLFPDQVALVASATDNVWDHSRVMGTYRERLGWHPCQMPEAILRRILLLCTDNGWTVLDPFVGSGTTLVVAKKLGRRGFGFELSADYAKRAQARLDSTTVELINE